MDLSGKKLLLIAPLYFDYYKEILKEARSLGMEADYICDAPSNSNISKALGRINKKLIQGPTSGYFKEKVLPIVTGKSYDLVLVIGGMTFAFTPAMVSEIKKHQASARFILYQWDSEKNLPYSVGIHPYFDNIYSFDMNDCEQKSKYRFLPLFYISAYQQIGQQRSGEFIYDCSYIGTAHPQKYRDIGAMTETLRSKMPRQFIYQYMPSRLKYVYHKIKDTEFRNAKWEEFQTQKLPVSEATKVFCGSWCILDAPQHGQTGLTIRTIECLGAKKKIITTNQDIRKYDFYDERNVLIYDGKIDWNAPFFTEEFRDIPNEIYDKYSLRSWLTEILDERSG